MDWIDKNVGEVDEHKLVAEILRTLSKFHSETVIVQPGDDAAVIASLVKPTLTADLLVEGVHFNQDWSSAADIGTKAAAANLADLIAMGAQPAALTVSLGIPNSLKVGYILELIAAIALEADLTGAQVVGGDVTASEKLIVSIAAVGDCQNRQPILRSGAQLGDRVGIIGRLGHAQAGWKLLAANQNQPAELIAAHLRPKVNYEAGRAAWSTASAMIDVSDGLLVDLGHIASASEKAIRLAPSRLAELISPLQKIAGQNLNVDPLDWILAGGEDHAFVVVAAKLPEMAVEIGKVESGSGVWLGEQPAELLGYRHFSE